VAIDQGLANNFDDPSDARLRVRDFLARVSPVARQVFKRIVTFSTMPRPRVSRSPETSMTSCLRPNGVEARLWKAFEAQESALVNARAQRRYGDMHKVLAAIEPEVSAFFDKGGVMVMDPDPALKKNRLALLHTIYMQFAMIGDLRLGGAG